MYSMEVLALPIDMKLQVLMLQQFRILVSLLLLYLRNADLTWNNKLICHPRGVLQQITSQSNSQIFRIAIAVIIKKLQKQLTLNKTL
jgi:hypothetical protein